MASTSETGHAKNVANFEDLISFCTGYGTTYNPSKDAFTIVKLQALHTQADKSLQQAKTTKTAFDNATNTRQLAFKDLKPLATKIVNALSASDATDLSIADAKTINRKIQGTKSGTPSKAPATPADPNAPTPAEKTISTSQQSYDSLIDNFAKLIEAVSQDANYNPNEIELQVTTLQTRLAGLRTSNTDVMRSLQNAYLKISFKKNEVFLYHLFGFLQ